jgi:TM2 domain-containing membrane protein YozV
MNGDVIQTKSIRSRSTAALLAIVFGGAGIHKFYLGKVGQGLLYILFSWTFLPLVIGIFEGLIYLMMSNQEFERKYS